jgi:RimJ/RimL family protein N-acetyltransferase
VALVALAGGHVIASAQLQRSRYGWTTHVGEIRVVIAHDFQRQGLGVALCRLLVKHAIAAGLEKIMAEVPMTRTTVAKAFEKLGFQREAVLKRHIKDVTGRKCDLAIFTNDVSHIWERMESLVSDYNPILGE